METRKEFDLIINEVPGKPSLFTREGIDIINSISWLLMDALWMFNLPRAGLLFGLPALVTGIALFYREKNNRAASWVNLATNCWITMNVLWMLSDTYPKQEALYLNASKSALMLGIFFVCVGAYRTGSITGAIAHYKRYKSLGDQKLRLEK